MIEEIESLHINDILKLAELPKKKKAIGCKWVYAKKEGSPDDSVHYKARLVTKGYAQREGIDYNEVFSLVVKHSSIRILWHLQHSMTMSWISSMLRPSSCMAILRRRFT